MPPQEEDVAFCTIDAGSVKGSLFYKQLTAFSKRKGEVGVAGKLIFNGLKGWSTQDPVPSYSYWSGDLESKGWYSRQPVPFYCYWTGDERKICHVQTLIRISAFKDNRFDVAKLNLEYHNPDTSNHIILSPDYDKNKKHFHLSYGAKPLEIFGFEIKEGKEGDIRHCIVIYSSFSSKN